MGNNEKPNSKSTNVGSKHKGSDLNYCEWCGKVTPMEKIQLPETPILENIEDKINAFGRQRIWGEYGDWSMEDIDSDFEAELLVYDELLNTITLKTVCERCIEEDDRLYNKYYENPDDEIAFWNDNF